MSLTDIKDKIISDAREEARKIESDAETKVRQILRDLLSEKEKLERDLEKELERSLKDNDNRHNSSLEREAKLKKEILKRSILDEVFTKSLKRLESCSEDEFKKFAERIFNSLPDVISGDILVLPKRIDAVKSLVKRYSNLSLKEDKSVKDGIVISGKDFQYDFTFENLLRGQRQNLELELSKTLFLPEE